MTEEVEVEVVVDEEHLEEGRAEVAGEVHGEADMEQKEVPKL